ADLCFQLAMNAQYIEPWLLNEVAPKAKTWIEIAEEEAEHLPEMYRGSTHLPELYKLFGIPDWERRYNRLREKMGRRVVEDRLLDRALRTLERLPQRQLQLEAECREGTGDLVGGAECYLAANDLASAVDCYRSIPDFAKAIELLAKVPAHPAKQSLEW